MEVTAETVMLADVRVRLQVIRMDGAVHVWASTDTSAPTLALSTPGRLAATSTLLGGMGANSHASCSLSARLASRTGLAVYACLQLPPDAEMLRDAVAKRLVEIIERPGAGRQNEAGAE